ncbi:MAG: hypothetical protein ACXU99_03120 [Thermodesulfobacteriota bacterium]
MITAQEEAYILEKAYVPEHIVSLMALISKGDYTEIKDLLRKIWDWWDENGRPRERVGELIEKVGMRTFLKVIGVKPTPQMIKAPRTNPYVFF